MSVTWNKKMRKTAGYCVTGQEKGGGNRYARIELSEKVCDSAGNGLLRSPRIICLSGSFRISYCAVVPEYVRAHIYEVPRLVWQHCLCASLLDRLRDTLIHEMCHAATWLINGVRDGHGNFWKLYARKATLAHPELPMVTRCHSYDIKYKFQYQCTRCKNTYVNQNHLLHFMSHCVFPERLSSFQPD